MNSGNSSWLLFFYRLLLRAYPAAYRAEFGNEMYATFLEGVEEAQAQKRLGIYLLKELRDTPRSLANAYWQGWMMKLQTRIQVLQDVASTSDSILNYYSTDSDHPTICDPEPERG